MLRVLASVDRSRSVSSMRRTYVPPFLRAHSQLKSAVRAPPTCRYPVGLGAKRTRIEAAALRRGHWDAASFRGRFLGTRSRGMLWRCRRR
jgi:hypothetical protein